MPSSRPHRPTPAACVAVAATASTLLTGCADAATEVTCRAGLVPAVTVEVRDPAGAPAAVGARLALRSAIRLRAPVDTTSRWTDELRLEAPTSRVDIYTVSVAKAGYRTAVVDDVVAPGTACGVERSIVVPVTLQPIVGD